MKTKTPSLEHIISLARKYCVQLAVNTAHTDPKESSRWAEKGFELYPLEQQARRGTLIMGPNPVLSGSRRREPVDSPSVSSVPSVVNPKRK